MVNGIWVYYIVNDGRRKGYFFIDQVVVFFCYYGLGSVFVLGFECLYVIEVVDVGFWFLVDYVVQEKVLIFIYKVYNVVIVFNGQGYFFLVLFVICGFECGGFFYYEVYFRCSKVKDFNGINWCSLFCLGFVLVI